MASSRSTAASASPSKHVDSRVIDASGRSAWTEPGSKPVSGVQDLSLGLCMVGGEWFWNELWAVTDQGTILRSGNGGKKWTTVASGYSGLNAIDYVQTGFSGWPPSGCAVGLNGAVVYLSTSDQSWKQSWKAGASGTTEPLTDVVFCSLTQAWAVGADGTILHSTDGGATWKPQVSGVSDTLLGVCFFGLKHGWAVGENGVILVTTDGRTWQPQSAPANVALQDVTFRSVQRGWACGDSGCVLHTSDGGAHWVAQSAPLDGDAQAIDFIDAKRGWVVDSDGVIAHTRDGGATWVRQASGMTTAGLTIDFIDRSTGWVAGGSAILHTTTGGWPDTTGPVTKALSKVTVRRGRVMTMWFRIEDEQCDWLRGGAIRIKRDGVTVKKLVFGQCAPDNDPSERTGQSWRCTLEPGRYRYYVYATDASGNKQSVLGWNTIRVK